MSAGKMSEDQETGESHLDRETGEEVKVCVVLPLRSSPTTDAETGEPEPQRSRRVTFQIPKSALRPVPSDSLVPINHKTLALAVQKPPPQCCIEKEVERFSRNTSPILFMLPTLFLFPGWASVLCIVIELICHAWAHNKNTSLKDSNLRYRSPLHLITSEFCAYCQSDKWMVKIGKLQQERKLKVNRRKLPYCSYVEKMSVIT